MYNIEKNIQLLKTTQVIAML